MMNGSVPWRSFSSTSLALFEFCRVAYSTHGLRIRAADDVRGPVCVQLTVHSMSKVFISYRRDDSAAWTGRLRDDLATMSGEKNIFYDLRDLLPGINWDNALRKTLDEADYVLVII